MIVVGFLICVAAGYFMQPAAKRVTLRIGKCWPFTPRTARMSTGFPTAQWIAKTLRTDTNAMLILDEEVNRIRRVLAQNTLTRDEMAREIERLKLRHRY